MPASSFWNFVSFILLNPIVISKVLSRSIILLSSQIVSKPHHSHCSSSTMYTSASPAWRGYCVISMACLCVTLLGAAFRANRLCLKLVHHDFHIYLKPKKINHHFGELVIVSALQICSSVCAKCNSSTLFGCSQHLWLVCGKATTEKNINKLLLLLLLSILVLVLCQKNAISTRSKQISRHAYSPDYFT